MNDNPRWTMIGLALCLAVVIAAGLVMTGRATALPVSAVQEDGGLVGGPADASLLRAEGTGPAATAPAHIGRGGGLSSISEATLATDHCYDPDITQTLCFEVRNGSTDQEWLDQVRLTFPIVLGDWTVSCNSQDTVDSSGSPVSLVCSTPLAYEVVFTDSTGGDGEITTGSSWSFCVDAAVPAGYYGPRVINWGLSGDDDGAPPHDTTGTLTVPECTPLMLKPDSLDVQGCNGITQTHVFELWNHSTSGGSFDLTYDVSPEGSFFSGPSSFNLSAGEIVTFVTQLKPDLFLDAGEQVTATLLASGGGKEDTSTLVNTITELAGWQRQTSSPIPSMDNVVVWAVEDGGLWSVGGYGSNGATQRYDPEAGTWITHTSELSPAIEYPGDACYGLDSDGHEVIVLFADTILTDTLHRYDIDDDAWDALPVPAFYPSEGRWAQDITSLYGVTRDNVCYLTGGATTDGGGNTKNLWVYYPDTNTGAWLQTFSHHWGFDFHASWYVPWVGNDGAICVGGGIDKQSGVIDATQCYDLETHTFNAPNADLGPLPEPWWGMADGWRTYEGRHQIWVANGVSQNGTLLPFSAYADETTGGFVYGPQLPVELYRLEGDGWLGQFYTLQGAAGGFGYSTTNHLLVQCPECSDVFLPLVLQDSGG